MKIGFRLPNCTIFKCTIFKRVNVFCGRVDRVKNNFVLQSRIQSFQCLQMCFCIIPFAKPPHNRWSMTCRRQSLHLGQQQDNAPGREPFSIVHLFLPVCQRAKQLTATKCGCGTDIMVLLPLMENLWQRMEGFGQFR